MVKLKRDKIKFHYLFNSTREYRKVSLEKVCHGMCSESMMYYIESGERLPNYRIRNRLMARLGVSSEEYEDFVQFDEYERWEKCQKLIDAVEVRDVDGATDILNDLLATSDQDEKIELQFLLDMKGRVMELQGAPWDEVLHVYEEAVGITMPDIDMSNIADLVLSPEEYYILLRLLRVKRKNSTYDDKCVLCEYYKSICDSIHAAFFQAFARAKVYPMAVCEWYKCADDGGILDNHYHEIWNNSERALLDLRNAARTYYLLDLLKLRERIGKLGAQYKEILSFSECQNKLEKEWIEVFRKIYDEYGIDPSMEYKGYIYIDSEVYCIADVIASRRKLYGLTIDELAEGVCSARTVMRIERKKARPQQYVVESLFRKMGMFSDYRRAEIMTNDYAVMEIYKAYKHAVNDADWDVASSLMESLQRQLNHNEAANRQNLADNLNEEKLRKKEITAERYKQNLEKVLGFTIPANAVFYNDCYLSNEETTILYNMARIGNAGDIRTMLHDRCEKHYKCNIRNHIGLYELIMGNEASRLGDSGDYVASNKISKYIIGEALQLYRSHSIHRNVFNILWNKAKESGAFSSAEISEELSRCISMAIYSKDIVTSEFYQNCLSLLQADEDWT